MSGASNHWAAQCVLAAQQGSQAPITNTTGANQQQQQQRDILQQQQQQHAANYSAAWTAQQQQQHYFYNYALQQHSMQQVQQTALPSAQPYSEYLLTAARTKGNCPSGEVVRRATAIARQTTEQREQPTAHGMPPSLKAYAERAFATCATDDDRATMQTKLHAIISAALHSGQLQTMDWDKAPVPTLAPAASDRKRVSSSSSQAAIPSKRRPFSEAERHQRESRAQRFGAQLSTQRASKQTSLFEHDELQVREPVKGTCTDLEKDYFRLTSAPDPSAVRPEPVLKSAVQRLKVKWKAGEVDYDWACNQLKAVRQDLTVQCIKNKFTVNVYETHARVALENADMNEYNQCQTQLKELYGEMGSGVGHPMEFLAYRIFYYLYLQHTAARGERSTAELLAILAEMPVEARAHDAVAHALAVAESVNTQNYAAFFRLHQDAPNMGQYILDMFADKIRVEAAYRIAKAYRPSLSIDTASFHTIFADRKLFVQLARQLGFDAVDDRFVAFIETIGFKLDSSRKEVLTKDSKIDPSKFAQHQSSLL